MKKNKNERKEALRIFLDELFENKFSERVKTQDGDCVMACLEEVKLSEDLDGEEEVCIEPFKLLEPEETLTLNEEELKEFNEMADGIQRMDELKVVRCSMDDTDREKLLVDGTNCNIKLVPLLDLALITPVNLSILELNMTDEMESELDIELTMALDMGENILAFKTTVNKLGELGLLMFTDINLPDAEMSSTEFRGLTKAVDLEELKTIFEGVGKDC